MPMILPLDILDKIIWNIRNDTPNLHQLALLSSDLAYLCQKYIFVSVSISELSCGHLHSVIESKPKLASYIQDLRIDWCGRALSDDLLTSLLERIGVAGTLRVFMLSIRMNDNPGEEFPDALKETFIKLVKSCDELRIVRLGDIFYNEFPLQLVTTNPHLDYLGFFYDYQEPHRIFDSVSLPPSSLVSTYQKNNHYLSTLEIGNSSALGVVTTLACDSSVSLSHLRHLILHRGSHDLISAVNVVLTHAADSIAEVSWIHPMVPDSNNNSDEVANLRALSHARSMKIFAWGAMNSFQINQSLREYGLPPNLETFSVVVDPACVFNLYFHPEVAHLLDEGFERILNGRTCRLLRSIRLCIVLGRYDRLQQLLRLRAVNFRKLFPLMHSSGKLEIVFEEKTMDDAIMMLN
ncbi:hypothetical protein H0H87_011650 [Tephrocybe sp. NHM501043]|nr:hypothetical protein H0H87_011650 [Tephrocybe sp. NHM501043]